MLRARAVPVLVMKVAAMIILPIAGFGSFVSTSTEYTTAIDVSDRAIPVIREAGRSHPTR